MVLIAVLDLTIDAAKKEEEKFATLRNCLEKQKEIFNECVKCKTQAKKMQVGSVRDSYIEKEIRQIQVKIRSLAQNDFLQCVGENMDDMEEGQQKSVFQKIFSYFITIGILMSVFNYATTGSKKRTKARK